METLKPSNPSRPLAPASFEGIQRRPHRSPLTLWTLTAAIPGHPAGSTLTGTTLEAAGYRLPPTHACDWFCDERQGGRRCPGGPLAGVQEAHR